MTDLDTINGHAVAIDSHGIARPGEFDVFVDGALAATVTRWAGRHGYTVSTLPGERFADGNAAIVAAVNAFTALGTCDDCGRDVFAGDDDDTISGDVLNCGACVRKGQETARRVWQEEATAQSAALRAGHLSRLAAQF